MLNLCCFLECQKFGVLVAPKREVEALVAPWMPRGNCSITSSFSYFRPSGNLWVAL